MATLPTPGADYDNWGTELNQFLRSFSYHVGDYGAVGDDSTDDTLAVDDAIGDAAAAGGQVFLPPGIYETTLNAAIDLDARMIGPGQVRDSTGDLRGPWFSAVTAAPASRGDWGSVVTAFNGDLSKTQLTMEHRVTGSTTLSQPTTGYVNNPEAAPINVYIYNESGWNQQTGGNDGRTGLAGMNMTAYNNGQGDLVCYTATAYAGQAKPGATSFLANPAAVLFNGGAFAGADGVYLNPVEIILDDQGSDVAAVGIVLGLDRTDATGALDTLWNGIRIHSNGSEDVDVGVMLHGATNGFLVGIDVSNAVLPTTGAWQNAAITLKADQKIYLDATGTDAGSSIYRRPSSPGTTWIDWSSSTLRLVAAGVPALQVQSTLITSAVNFQVAAGKFYLHDGTAVVGPRVTGWAAATGTPTRSTFATGSVTLPQLAERVKALIDDLMTHGLIGT